MRNTRIVLALISAIAMAGCPRLTDKNSTPYVLSAIQALAAARAGFAEDNPLRVSETLDDLKPYLMRWGASDVEERLQTHGAEVRFESIALHSEAPRLWLIIRRKYFRLPSGAVRGCAVAGATVFVFGISPSGEIREIDDEKVIARLFSETAPSPIPAAPSAK